jgi:hypothetical protein
VHPELTTGDADTVLERGRRRFEFVKLCSFMLRGFNPQNLRLSPAQLFELEGFTVSRDLLCSNVECIRFSETLNEWGDDIPPLLSPYWRFSMPVHHVEILVSSVEKLF